MIFTYTHKQVLASALVMLLIFAKHGVLITNRLLQDTWDEKKLIEQPLTVDALCSHDRVSAKYPQQHPWIPPCVFFTNPVCFVALHVIQSPLLFLLISSPLSLCLYLLILFTGWGVSTDSSDTQVMEGGDHSVGGSDESPSEAEFLSGREEGLLGAHNDEQMRPDCWEDMEDSDSLVSEQLLFPGTRAGGPGLSLSPAWPLAFFGEECFGPEVIQYAMNLGRHSGSPCLDVKTQVGKPVEAPASESHLTFIHVWTKTRLQRQLIYLSDRITLTISLSASFSCTTYCSNSLCTVLYI